MFYHYNKANLVTSVLNKKGTTTLSSHTYTYYLDGNIASETANSVETAYEYDGLGRLTKENRNGTITLYTYDACGNRATMTQNNVTTTYTYDANNRLWKETVAGIATTYAYDANGNMISALKGGNAAGAYTYNLFGNQISYTINDSSYTYYTYRPDGLRHSIDDKVHVWDGSNIVADIDGNNVSVYIRGVNLIYADDGDRTYYHFNAHGDVVVLTNASGNKTKSYAYNAFGDEFNESTLDDNPFRYCGEYYDKETQTIYLRARYYNAEQGRFTQEDTHWNVSNMIYGDAPDNTVPDQSAIIQSGNLYVYCGNNPVVRKDSIGCFWDTVFDVVSLAMSVVDVATNPTNLWAWAGLVGDIVDIVPFVSGVGEATKAVGATIRVVNKTDGVVDTIKVVKATDFTDEALETISKLEKVEVNGYTRTVSNALDGTKIHQGYKSGQAGKEFVREANRMDFYKESFSDTIPNTIFELKPNNPQGIRDGIKQLRRYNEAMGGNCELILELY